MCVTYFLIRKETIMNCANCGKEFGTGTHCQHCGVDRVTGLANYNGYNNSGDSSGYNSSNFGGSPKTTVCYACSEIIPLGSTFCPVCGKKLLVTCPKCGHEYSSQYPVCNKCGTNREEYNKQLEVERQRKIIEEQEKERQRIEWEQAQRQRAQQIAQEDVGCLKGMIGFASLCSGILLLLVVLFVHFTFPKQSNENLELNFIIGGAIVIILGSLILKSKRE